MNFHVAVYVGPTLVPTMACKFRQAGILVTVEGTMHIHCVVPGSDSFIRMLLEKHNTTFGIKLSDVTVIRETSRCAQL